MLADGTVDLDFVRAHTDGWEEVVAELERESFDDLERLSGTTRADMERFARMYATASSAVVVWSMGITQHEHGADNVAAIVNRALPRRHALRAARRWHRDHDRATHRLQPRDTRAPPGRGPQRVGDLRRSRPSGRPRTRCAVLLQVGPADPRRDRARRPRVLGGGAAA